MKIKLETIIDSTVLQELNTIIALCQKENTNLIELEKDLNRKNRFDKIHFNFEHLIWGRSGNHIWVSYELSGKRILMITE